MNRRTLQSGIALVEMLVVVGIIFILSSIIYTSLQVNQRRVADARTKADIEQIKFALEVYYQEHGGYPNPQGPTPPILPSLPSGDLMYCVGTNECIFNNVNHTGVAPLVLESFSEQVAERNTMLAAVINVVARFNLSHLHKYLFGTETYQGYFYRCMDLQNQGVQSNATTCPSGYEVYLYYPLYKKADGNQGIEELAIVSGTSNVSGVQATNECPDPSLITRPCTQGSLPPTAIVEIEPVPSGGGGGGTQYIVTTSAWQGCTITPTASYSAGTNVTITIGTVDSTYDISDVIVDGGSQGQVTSAQFNGISQPHTVEAQCVDNGTGGGGGGSGSGSDEGSGSGSDEGSGGGS